MGGRPALDGRTRVLRNISQQSSGCWLWTGSAGKDGYGVLRASGKYWRAHRWSYVHFIGPIPDGHEVDHLCFRPLCVNPAHLEAVTPEENTRRALVAGRFGQRQTHCKRGHPLDGDNLWVRTWHGKTLRQCKTCHRTWRERRDASLVA